MVYEDKLIVTELENKDSIPYQLLLIADPSEKKVKEYVNLGKLYLCNFDDEVIGAYVLINTESKTMEIANIVVDEKWRGKGIGKFLINDAIQRTRKMGATTLEIGTGNSSLNQLGLYQKCGFRIISVDKDYFSRHYNEKIIENGIECVDMIRLSKDL